MKNKPEPNLEVTSYLSNEVKRMASQSFKTISLSFLHGREWGDI
jgi:hypothetical protein